MKTVPGAVVTGAAMWAAAHARVAQWDQRIRDPKAVQLSTLLSHVRTAEQTEFGRANGFDRIRSYEDFTKRVVVRSYADCEADLQRMRAGAENVLWPGLIPLYGQSSGSSSTAAMNKFLPISMAQIKWQQRAGLDVVARYLVMSGDREFTGGYTLGLFPPAVVKPAGPDPRVSVGSNPGIMLRHLPAAARLMTLPRPPVRDIEDYDAKLTAIAEAYLDYDVRALSGTTCWFSIFFDRLLSVARKQGRTARTVSDVWPRLSVLFGGGINAEPYRRIIDDRVGRPTMLVDNYNATEGGIFAATDIPGDDSMLVIPDRGVFFEFVPREEHGKPNPTRVPLWRVERGVDYSVTLTTCSGLFAYAIGDYVRFTSVTPYRIQFAGRASGVLSLTQELTSSIELERAVAAAGAAHPSTIVDFAAGSEVGFGDTAKGRYLFFVEFDRDPEDLAAFTRAVDAELCNQNRVYREHRTKDAAILPPRMVALGRGATRKFMEALGQNSVQHKFPRIVDERRRDLLLQLARTDNPGVTR